MWESTYALVVQAVAGAQEAAPQQTAEPGNPFAQMLPMFILFAVIFWLFFIAPQRKQERKRQEMLRSLSKGDRVMTNGGIFGTVVGLTDKTVVLRVSDEPAVKLEFVKGAVTRVVPKDSDAEAT